MHYRAKTAVKVKFEWLLAAKKLKKHKGEVSVSIVNYANQLMDWDNLASTFKIIGDALVKLGVIIDDNPKVVIEFKMAQKRVRTKKEENLVYIIEDYDILNDHSDK